MNGLSAQAAAIDELSGVVPPEPVRSKRLDVVTYREDAGWLDVLGIDYWVETCGADIAQVWVHRHPKSPAIWYCSGHALDCGTDAENTEFLRGLIHTRVTNGGN